MKITHNKVGQNLNVSDTKTDKASGTSTAGGVNKNSKASESSAVDSSAAGSQATKVELSPRAKDIQQIKQLAKNAPDVDMDKVEKFKRLIADGKYKVDAKAVADRMVDDHLATAGGISDE